MCKKFSIRYSSRWMFLEVWPRFFQNANGNRCNQDERPRRRRRERLAVDHRIQQRPPSALSLLLITLFTLPPSTLHQSICSYHVQARKTAVLSFIRGFRAQCFYTPAISLTTTTIPTLSPRYFSHLGVVRSKRQLPICWVRMYVYNACAILNLLPFL